MINKTLGFFKIKFLYCLLFLFSINANSQEFIINVKWQNPKQIFFDKTNPINAISFENAKYGEFIQIPHYSILLGNFENDNFDYEVEFKDLIFAPLTLSEQEIFDKNNFKPDTALIANINSNMVRGNIRKELIFYPFVSSKVTEQLKKLISGKIIISRKLKTEISNLNLNTKSLRPNISVLSSGRFYMLSVNQPGIYKITYSQLQDLGVNVQNINPRNIRIYGNGGQMLPEKNNDNRIFDLHENSIFVFGESDGVFNSSDYILFYAKGPNNWIWDSILKRWKFVNNIYENKSFYFLTVDKGSGKRINSVNNMSESPNITNNIFLDRAHHEIEQLNLIKSGKEWYGEVFDINLNQTFNFAFANAVLDSCINIQVSMAARAPGNTSAIVTSGQGVIPFSFSGTSSATSDFAIQATGSMCVSGSSSPAIQITYNRHGFSDAKAWLDFISVNAWRNLRQVENQMHFSNPLIVENQEFARYQIANASNVIVWDITNFLDPVRTEGTFNGSTFSFISDASVVREFISFNGNSFLTPVFEGIVQNQNLHSFNNVDYVIVTNQLFIEEARKLAEFHRNYSNLTTVVLTPQQIYNEFSSGSQDISAIRDFMKMLYDRAQTMEDKPKYLLFFGRASFNYKDKSQNNTNFVPTFQSSQSHNPTSSYATDDFFGLLDDGEGFDCNGHLDIGIGRLPVSTKQEAKNMVDKIIRYHNKTNSANNNDNCNFLINTPNLADWRNVITFISDDADNNYHFNQSEGLSNMLSTYNFLNIDKIHLDAFPQHSTPGGERAPLVNVAINSRIRQGSLIMNYTGHGGELGWAHERILEISDINSWNNSNNMPLFITATCEFSRFDDPKNIAAGELVLLNKNGGGIALFSTTRLAFANYNEMLNRSVYKIAFETIDNRRPTLGEIFAFSKTDNNSNLYMRNFILLGDPAMQLAYPSLNVVTTEINGKIAGAELDTVSAMSFVTVKGFVADNNGNKLDNFNGVIYPTVFDKANKITTLASNPIVNTPADFFLQNSILHKGKASVVNGEFTFSFYVPKDINYSLGKGKISYYAENGLVDATGYFDDFYIGGPERNFVEDNKGPDIRLYLNDTTFKNGGTTNENPVLIAYLHDSTGINTTGSGIGHDIITILDGSGEVIVLNSYYQSDINSFQSGRVVFPFENLSEGVHSLYFKAWDVLNNSSDAAISFIVAPSHEAIIRKLFNYPNPFNEFTDFIFQHNQSCVPLQITIDIYNNLGIHVNQLNATQTSLGYQIEPLRWYGTSANGQTLPSGVYVYNLRIKTCDGYEAQKGSKLVIIK